MDTASLAKISLGSRPGGTVALLLAFLVLPLPIAMARPLTVGTISSVPSEQIERLAPLAAYLAAPLRSDGFDGGHVVVAGSVSEMVGLLQHGRVDVYVDQPMTGLAVSDLTESRMTFCCGATATGESRSIIFTRRGTGIRYVEDLPGHLLAFASPFSTFGYLLPKLMISERGVSLRQSGGGPVPEGVHARYVFSGDDESTVVWVLRGKADVGAVAEEAYRRYGKKNGEKLQVIEETLSLPAWIVSLRGTLPGGMISRLRAGLVAMTEQAEGRRALRQAAGFDQCALLSERMLSPLLGTRPFVQAQFGTP